MIYCVKCASVKSQGKHPVAVIFFGCDGWNMMCVHMYGIYACLDIDTYVHTHQHIIKEISFCLFFIFQVVVKPVECWIARERLVALIDINRAD